MSKVKITVGGTIEDEASRRFVDAWHRGERGESFRERHLAFESWDALARVLTGKRMELLRYVRRHKVTSVRALAKALGRDYSPRKFSRVRFPIDLGDQSALIEVIG